MLQIQLGAERPADTGDGLTENQRRGIIIGVVVFIIVVVVAAFAAAIWLANNPVQALYQRGTPTPRRCCCRTSFCSWISRT